MKRQLDFQAENFIRERKRHTRLRRAIALLCAIVMLLTMNSLKMSADTLERIPDCGLEEHRHTLECYPLICPLAEAEPRYEVRRAFTGDTRPHIHSADCYDDAGNLACGYVEGLYYHVHNRWCYDDDGNLVCGLSEIRPHEHTEACYQDVPVLICGQDEYPAHHHTADCYFTVRELACGLEENPGHIHSDECYYDHYELTCGLEESVGHIHTSDCYIPVVETTCGMEEGPGHIHTAECYTRELVCEELESEAHQHTDECYADVLTCEIPEGYGAHTHTESCYTVYNILVCGIPEGEGAHRHTKDCVTSYHTLICSIPEGEGAHTHTDHCYIDYDYLVCGQEETEGHTHTDACYEHTTELICGEQDGSEWAATMLGQEGVQVHTHTDECFTTFTRTLENGEERTLRFATCGYLEIPTITCRESDWTSYPVQISQGHAHTAACYDLDAEPVCGMAEHEHTDACFQTRPVKTEDELIPESAGDGDADSVDLADLTEATDSENGENKADALSDGADAETDADGDLNETENETPVDSDENEAANQEQTEVGNVESAEAGADGEPTDASDDGEPSDNKSADTDAADKAGVEDGEPADETAGGEPSDNESADADAADKAGVEDGEPADETADGEPSDSEPADGELTDDDTAEGEPTDEEPAGFTAGERVIEVNDGSVTLAWGPEAEIPEDVRVEVVEIERGTPDYDILYNNAMAALSEKKDTETTTQVMRFFDITLYDGEEKLEPKAAISVTVKVNEAEATEDDNDVDAIHMEDVGAEAQVVEATTDSDTVSFEAESFSIYGVVVDVPATEAAEKPVSVAVDLSSVDLMEAAEVTDTVSLSIPELLAGTDGDAVQVGGEIKVDTDTLLEGDVSAPEGVLVEGDRLVLSAEALESGTVSLEVTTYATEEYETIATTHKVDIELSGYQGRTDEVSSEDNTVTVTAVGENSLPADATVTLTEMEASAQVVDAPAETNEDASDAQTAGDTAQAQVPAEAEATPVEAVLTADAQDQPEAAEEAAPATGTVEGSASYDITITNANEDVISETGLVKVVLQPENLNIYDEVPSNAVVKHVSYTLIHEHEGETTELPVSVKTDDDGKVTEITFKTEKFSTSTLHYTVDFEYIDEAGEAHTWSFPGIGSYRLSEVLTALDIEFETITDADLERVETVGEYGEYDLYLTQDEDGERWINSDAAFDDAYELTVVADGKEYVITVTDDPLYTVNVEFRDTNGNLTTPSSLPLNQWENLYVYAMLTLQDGRKAHLNGGQQVGTSASSAAVSLDKFVNGQQYVYTDGLDIELSLVKYNDQWFMERANDKANFGAVINGTEYTDGSMLGSYVISITKNFAEGTATIVCREVTPTNYTIEVQNSNGTPADAVDLNGEPWYIRATVSRQDGNYIYTERIDDKFVTDGTTHGKVVNGSIAAFYKNDGTATAYEDDENVSFALLRPRGTVTEPSWQYFSNTANINTLALTRSCVEGLYTLTVDNAQHKLVLKKGDDTKIVYSADTALNPISNGGKYFVYGRLYVTDGTKQRTAFFIADVPGSNGDIDINGGFKMNRDGTEKYYYLTGDRVLEAGLVFTTNSDATAQTLLAEIIEKEVPIENNTNGSSNNVVKSYTFFENESLTVGYRVEATDGRMGKPATLHLDRMDRLSVVGEVRGDANSFADSANDYYALAELTKDGVKSYALVKLNASATALNSATEIDYFVDGDNNKYYYEAGNALKYYGVMAATGTSLDWQKALAGTDCKRFAPGQQMGGYVPTFELSGNTLTAVLTKKAAPAGQAHTVGVRVLQADKASIEKPMTSQIYGDWPILVSLTSKETGELVGWTVLSVNTGTLNTNGQDSYTIPQSGFFICDANGDKISDSAKIGYDPQLHTLNARLYHVVYGAGDSYNALRSGLTDNNRVSDDPPTGYDFMDPDTSASGATYIQLHDSYTKDYHLKLEINQVGDDPVSFVDGEDYYVRLRLDHKSGGDPEFAYAKLIGASAGKGTTNTVELELLKDSSNNVWYKNGHGAPSLTMSYFTGNEKSLTFTIFKPIYDENGLIKWANLSKKSPDNNTAVFYYPGDSVKTYTFTVKERVKVEDIATQTTVITDTIVLTEDLNGIKKGEIDEMVQQATEFGLYTVTLSKHATDMEANIGADYLAGPIGADYGFSSRNTMVNRIKVVKRYLDANGAPKQGSVTLGLFKTDGTQVGDPVTKLTDSNGVAVFEFSELEAGDYLVKEKLSDGRWYDYNAVNPVNVGDVYTVNFADGVITLADINTNVNYFGKITSPDVNYTDVLRHARGGIVVTGDDGDLALLNEANSDNLATVYKAGSSAFPKTYAIEADMDRLSAFSRKLGDSTSSKTVRVINMKMSDIPSGGIEIIGDGRYVVLNIDVTGEGRVITPFTRVIYDGRALDPDFGKEGREDSSKVLFNFITRDAQGHAQTYNGHINTGAEGAGILLAPDAVVGHLSGNWGGTIICREAQHSGSEIHSDNPNKIQKYNTMLTNSGNELQTGDLELKKDVDGSPDRTTWFTFEITLKNASDELVSGSFVVNGLRDANQTMLEFVDGKAPVEVRAQNRVLISGIPAGYKYSIVEVATHESEFYQTSEVQVNGEIKPNKVADGTIRTAANKAEFTNTRKTGGLKVTKTVEHAADGDDNKDFEFRVTLTLALDQQVEAGVNEVTYGGVTFTRQGQTDNFYYEFTLKDGEERVFESLPQDTDYTITETADNDFTTTYTGNTGTIGDVIPAANFVNTRKADLKVVKQWTQYGAEAAWPAGAVIYYAVEKIPVVRYQGATVELSSLKETTLVDATNNTECALTGTHPTHTFTGLPRTGMITLAEAANGVPAGTYNVSYKYVVTESTDSVPPTGSSYTYRAVAVTAEDDDNDILTATLINDYTEITVEKVWDGYTPTNDAQVVMKLYRSSVAPVSGSNDGQGGEQVVIPIDGGGSGSGGGTTPVAETTSATVTLAWSDANNQDGKRPGSVTATLSNGTEVTLSESNSWTATVNDLPTGSSYTWTGETVTGYTSASSTDGTATTLTYSHTPETTSATVQLAWDDANNQDGSRPGSVTATLSNGQSVTLSESNSWTATVNDLPKYAGGTEISYTWSEPNVPAGYTLTSSVSGATTTLTNSHTPASTDVPETISITFTIPANHWFYANGGHAAPVSRSGHNIWLNIVAGDWQHNITTIYGDPVSDQYGTVLAFDDTWTVTVEDLPKYQMDSGNNYVLDGSGNRMPVTYIAQFGINQGGPVVGVARDAESAEAENTGESITVSGNDATIEIYAAVPVPTDTKVIEATTEKVGSGVDDDWYIDIKLSPISEANFVNLGRITSANTSANPLVNATSISQGRKYYLEWNENSVRRLSDGSVRDDLDVEIEAKKEYALDQWWNMSMDDETLSTFHFKVSKKQESNTNQQGSSTSGGEPTGATGVQVLSSDGTVMYSSDSFSAGDSVTITITRAWYWSDNYVTNSSASGNLGDKDTYTGGSDRVFSQTFVVPSGGLLTFQLQNTTKDNFGHCKGVEFTRASGSVSAVSPFQLASNFLFPTAYATESGAATRILIDAVNAPDVTGMTEIDTVTLSNSTDWEHTWTGLPTSDGSGNPYYYYLVETEVTGIDATSVTATYDTEYTQVGSVNYIKKTTVTNTPAAPETGSLIIEKDVRIGNKTPGQVDDALKGLADGTYTFGLYTDENCTEAYLDANNEAVTRTITISGGTSRTAIISGLPEGDYWVKELSSTNPNVTLDTGKKAFHVTAGNDASPELVAAINPVSFTNVYELTKVKVTKDWQDSGNQDGKRPTSVTVQLKKDGANEGDQVILSAANSWTYTWENLAKKNGSAAISYTVEEVGANNNRITFNGAEYTVTINNDTAFTEGTGYTIVNGYTPATTEASVVKVWNDASNQDGIRPETLTVKLLADSVETGTTVTLTQSDNWAQKTVGNLPKYAGGVEIAYTWAEDDLPEGYELTGNTKDGTVTTLTNTHTPETTTVEVRKTWNHGSAWLEGMTVTMTLKADGDTPTIPNTSETTTAAVELSAGKTFARWTNLPKKSGGVDIDYTVSETAVSYNGTPIENYGTVFTVSGEGGGTNNLVVIDNETKTTERHATKVWDDSNNAAQLRPASITFTLFPKVGGTALTAAELARDGISGLEQQATAANNWTVDWDPLPAYTMTGAEITYDVVETAVANYTQIGQPTWNDTTKTWTFTNRVGVTEITLPGTKTMKGGEPVTGTYDFTLSATEGTPMPSGATSANGMSTVTVHNSGTNNQAIDFGTIRYTLSDMGNPVQSPKTFTYTVKETTGSAAGIVYDRAEYTVNVAVTYNAADGTLTASDPTYTKTVGGETSSANAIAFENEEVVDVDVTKTWGNGQQPPTNSTITVKLTADGIDDAGLVTLTGLSSLGVTLDGSESNPWHHQWTDLPKYNGAGVAVDYSVEETSYVIDGHNYHDELPGAVSGAAYSLLVTNRIPTTTFEATKAWVNGNDNTPPEGATITVTLYKGATEEAAAAATTAVSSIVLNGEIDTTASNAYEDDAWHAKWSNLPMYGEDGVALVYVAKETAYTGYTASYPQTTGGEDKDYALNNETITNTEDEIQLEGKKTWVDDKAANVDNATRPATLKIELYKVTDGVETQVTLQTESSDRNYYLRWDQTTNPNVWTYTITHLPKYDASGRQIVYRVKEIVRAGYSARNEWATGTVDQTTGNITDADFLNTEVTSIHVTKAWILNEQPTMEPDGITSITVHLRRVDKDATKYIGTDLAVYDSETSEGYSAFTISRVYDSDTDTYSWETVDIENLPKCYMADGVVRQYSYYFTEDADSAPGWTATYSKPGSAPALTGVSVSTNGDETITITNTRHTYALPSTGGMGTTLIYIAGASLLMLAVLGFVWLNRKRDDGTGI